MQKVRFGNALSYSVDIPKNIQENKSIPKKYTWFRVPAFILSLLIPYLFIVSGYDKAYLFDFNYKTEPLPGKYPFPGLGPFELVGESNINYWGKMMFKWVYWNMMLKGVELPLEDQLKMAGKMRHSLVTA